MGHMLKSQSKKKVSPKSVLHILPLLLKSKTMVVLQPDKLQNCYLGSLQQFKWKYNTNIETCTNTLRVQLNKFSNGSNLGRLEKKGNSPEAYLRAVKSASRGMVPLRKSSPDDFMHKFRNLLYHI